jgi:hypothetical protein
VTHHATNASQEVIQDVMPVATDTIIPGLLAFLARPTAGLVILPRLTLVHHA